MQQLYTAYLLTEEVKDRFLARKVPFSETVLFIKKEILYLTFSQLLA